MPGKPVDDSGRGGPAAISQPYLVWRILVLAFCLGAALTLVRNVLLVAQGEPVEIMQMIFSLGFLAFGAWLYPQRITVTDDGVELARGFGLLRTRIPLNEIDFYWETNSLAMKEYQGKGNYDDVRDRRVASRQPAVLITARGSHQRIVLSHYHAGRDQVVEALRQRGVRNFETAVQDAV